MREVYLQTQITALDGGNIRTAATERVSKVYEGMLKCKNIKDFRSLTLDYEKRMKGADVFTVTRLIDTCLTQMEGPAAIKPWDKIWAFAIQRLIRQSDVVLLSWLDVKRIMWYAKRTFNPLMCGRLAEVLGEVKFKNTEK